MKVHQRPLAWAIVLLLALFVSCMTGAHLTASADDATPIPDGSTAVPTLAAPTQIPAPEPTQLPTVQAESSTPITTVESIPTVNAEPVYSPTADTIVQPTAVVVEPTILTAPTETSGTAPPSVTWPTADQLRQNAALRWGKGIPKSVRRWAFLIVPAAKKYHLDPNLIAAVMTMESNGDPLAWSGADARGLMQILHGPWDPQENVLQGAKMLSDLYAQFGDWSLVLAAYNAGPGAVEAYGGVPPYRETHDYVIIVNYLWDLYGHHHLTVTRKALFRSTLRDLQHFKDQRRKIKKLASIGKVPADLPSVCATTSCGASSTTTITETPDPFWPVGGTPDPLQKVDPYKG